jgi:hypothetical protein
MKPASRATVLHYVSRRRQLVVQEVTAANMTHVPGVTPGDIVWWPSDEPNLVWLLHADPTSVAANEGPRNAPLPLQIGCRDRASGNWSWAAAEDALVDDWGNVYMRHGKGILHVVPRGRVDQD